MIVNHDDELYVDFNSGAVEWYGGLSSAQLSSGFGTPAGAPPVLNASGPGEQAWANAYEAWHNGLDPADLANGVYNADGDSGPHTGSPPPPPPGS